MVPKVLSVAPRECPEELVLTASRILKEGGLVALPTETVYGVAALLDGGEGERRLRALKERDQGGKELTIHLADGADAQRWAAPMPWCARRLAARYWPGSLTLVVAGREEERVGLRVPSRLFTRAVIQAATDGGTPLVMSSANLPGETPATSADQVVAGLGDRLDLVIDGGPAELGESSTVVQALEPSLEILRQGTLRRAEVEAHGCWPVLFICSGNTCRSPMAQALAIRATADSRNIPQNEYTRSGLLFLSAGTGTLPGMPASENALLATEEVGADLTSHRSNHLHPGLLQAVRQVYCMTGSHLERARSLPAGDDPPAMELLDPEGRDLPDPFGGDLAEYRRCRDRIARSLALRLPHLLAAPWSREG